MLLRISVMTFIAAVGCGDGDDAGAGGGGAACRLVGDPITLTAKARGFDIAATATGWDVIFHDADGTGSQLVDGATGALGARVRVPLVPRDGDVRVEAAGAARYATSVFNAVFEGLPMAQTNSGEWSVVTSVEAAQGKTFSYGSTLVVHETDAAEPEVVVVWVGASGLESSLLFASWQGAWGAYGAIGLGADLKVGVEVAAAFDNADTLHVVVTGEGADGNSGLYVVTRDTAGSWSAPRRLGDLEGSFQGQSIVAATASSAGAFAVGVMPASFADGTDGGVFVHALGDGGAKRVNGPRDARPVVEGVDAAPLGDGRIVVSAAWGENNLDFEHSDDEVLLYTCSAQTCSQALAVDGTRGTFFGQARVATRGQDGAIVYAAEPKGGQGEERVVVRRFTCPTP